jgi:hypothetical protein
MVVEPSPGTPSARWLAALVVGALPLVLIATTYARWRSRLPDPLPTHWGLSGRVDGTTSLVGFAATTLVIAGVGGLLAALGAAASALRWHTRRVLVTVGAAVGAFAAALWLMVAVLSLDRSDAFTVPTPSWHIPAMLLGLVVWAGVAFGCCGPAPARKAATGRPGAALPRVHLSPGQPAVWSELGHPGGWAYLVLLPLAAIGGVIAVLVNPWAASPVLFPAVVVLVVLTVRLAVDRRGLLVGFGPWGWPRLTMPLREIEYAEVTALRPSEWGGWGYRMRPGGRGVILRAGPGVRLRLSEDRQFVASTRDPQTAAGLINTLIDREARRPG